MDDKTVKKMGIRFPIGSQNQAGRNNNSFAESKINPDGTLATPLSLANTIELIGFISEEERRFPSDNTIISEDRLNMIMKGYCITKW